MPNKILLPYPPELGDELRSVYSYLYQLVEQLNICLGAVDAEQISGAMKDTLDKISGVNDRVTRMGSSTSEAMVSALKLVKTQSDEMDTEIRARINEVESGLSEAIEKAAGETLEESKAYTDSGIETVRTELSEQLDTDISEAERAIADIRADLDAYRTAADGRMTALEARVTALETKS